MKRTPARGGKEPETMCLQAVGALWHHLLPSARSIRFGELVEAAVRLLRETWVMQRVTACLLHNDPASYRQRLG
jgi:hypothetical protein